MQQVYQQLCPVTCGTCPTTSTTKPESFDDRTISAVVNVTFDANIQRFLEEAQRDQLMKWKMFVAEDIYDIVARPSFRDPSSPNTTITTRLTQSGYQKLAQAKEQLSDLSGTAHSELFYLQYGTDAEEALKSVQRWSVFFYVGKFYESGDAPLPKTCGGTEDPAECARYFEELGDKFNCFQKNPDWAMTVRCSVLSRWIQPCRVCASLCVFGRA